MKLSLKCKRIFVFVIFTALCFFTTKDSFPQKILNLENSLEIAMINSPDIKRVEYNLERSQQSLNAQNAALKSRFSLSITPFDYITDRRFNDLGFWLTSETKQSFGTFTVAQPIKWTDGTLALINRFSWRDAFSENPLFETTTKTYDNNLYLSFQQPIFTYNRTKLALRELELDLENTQLSYDIQELALERLVTQNFYQVYQQKSGLDIAFEELKNQEQSYQIIKNKVDAGLVAQEDLFQAELILATSQSRLQNEQVALANALDNFKLLIGISLYDSIMVVADVSHFPVKVDVKKAIDYGLKHRMELRQRKIDIDNSMFSLIQTSAMNEFKGNINLSLGIIGTDENFGQVYESPTRNQRVSLSFEIPLFDWGEKKARIKASEANIKSRELSFEDVKNGIIIGIRQITRSMLNLENQIEIARQNVRNAQLTYDINIERYEYGDLSSMDLSLFQNQLSQKKMNLVQSLIDYKLALLNLKIQSLWDFEKNRSVLKVEN